jgi:outer membrane murein-binding lipoprotein Lpp
MILCNKRIVLFSIPQKMKKIVLISLLLSGVVLAGCGNNQETELLKQQNALLQSQLQQNTEQVQQDKNFEKNLKCQER